MGEATPQSAKSIDIDAINALWTRFSRAGTQLVTLEDLANVMADLGQALEDAELRHLLEDCNAPDGLGKDQFTVLMASWFGDTRAASQFVNREA